MLNFSVPKNLYRLLKTCLKLYTPALEGLDCNQGCILDIPGLDFDSYYRL